MSEQRRAKNREGGLAPTLEDVSRKAGVSTATVSRCLNEPNRVSEATRKKVMSAVDLLGYTPNFGAQALAAKRTNTFGAIVPTMENAIFARALQAFQEELERNGITLLVASSSYNPENEEKQIRTLVARGADALLLIGHQRSNRIYEFLKRRDVPVVVAWVHNGASSQASVGFDNNKAMKSLVLQVLERGHREIGYISGVLDGNDRTQGRFDGLKEAMAGFGLPASALHMVETPYSIENGAAALDTLLEGGQPTAVMCANDVLAVGAMTRAHQLGIKVPEDLSITGFDDIEIAQIVSPGLTTVHVPHREMGQRCAQTLIALRNGQDHAPVVELRTEIKHRASLSRIGG